MENKTLISVIVPVYKVEQYLHKCLDSIVNQTYRKLEIILIDDGSPDNCGKICDEYAQKDERVKVIHKENGGLSSARNAGLDIAKGEYIAFVDSDDCISEIFIETLYNLCIENKVKISECNFEKFEDEIEQDNLEETTIIYSSYEMQNRLYGKDSVRTVVVWNKLYEKSIYNNLRFPIGKINEDEFTTYKAFYDCKTKIAVTNQKLYYYRYNSNSIMGKKFNIKRYDVFDALEERKNFYKDRKQTLLYNKTLLKYRENLMYFYMLTLENVDEPEKFLKFIHEKFKENYNEFKSMPNLNLFSKVKMNLFFSSPRIYKLLQSFKGKLRLLANINK